MSARRDRTISKEVNARGHTVIKKDLRSAGMCLAERLVLKITRSISLGKYCTISVVYHSKVCLILSFKQLTILLNLLLL